MPLSWDKDVAKKGRLAALVGGVDNKEGECQLKGKWKRAWARRMRKADLIMQRSCPVVEGKGGKEVRSVVAHLRTGFCRAFLLHILAPKKERFESEIKGSHRSNAGFFTFDRLIFSVLSSASVLHTGR
jgi:hypothetical protein